jgi:hypothetical protein
MASRLGLLTLCNLCEKVYDEDRSVWVKVEEHGAYYATLPDGYAFTGTFCDACRKLYSVMIGRHNKANHVDCSTVGDGILAAEAPDRPLEVSYGLA